MPKKLTLNDFIEKAKEIHGDKYDYSKVEYVNSHTKVCIICKEHGEFWQKPYSHLNGYGCPKCGGTKKLTSEEFINKAKEIHGDKYDYSKVKYINNRTKVCIICPIHGEFWQKPNVHLNGHGCLECSGKQKISSEEFIEKARQVHGNKYDYSKVEYINAFTKVCIICPIHGEFWQKPNDHLNNHGCAECSGTKKLTSEEFINKAKEIHGDKYDYSKVKYINIHSKVCIICKKHGEFWQTPDSHLSGRGCPKCKMSKLEDDVINLLKEQNITFEYNKYYKLLDNLQLDFYLPEYNIAIECQGGQHFKCIAYFGGEKGYKSILERDKLKHRLCEENGIKLLYYSNLGIEYPYKVFENKEELLKEIL